MCPEPRPPGLGGEWPSAVDHAVWRGKGPSGYLPLTVGLSRWPLVTR